ncbi:transmembrane protein 245 isoform X2 [Eurytemora carolleeae]|uniref:transmembrane protein 245 isoform X2 n=1 Tax=Eurytemora carolleeae TaxID=1294199 RepID=UPI000C76A48A|nr:transmembrane protein 245 isoform X2 [Eurytemora carolleeae]|eukprot:XP_023325507.1 transmembrane protein 245-like isoform X2 [Eurytemora affinis]
MQKRMTSASFDLTPGAGSPFFDDLRQDKEIRNSFLHAIALTILAVILTGAYYVYSILEPFIVPLFWALLTGVLLHPHKKSATNKFRLYLTRLQQNDKNVVFSLSHNILKLLDKSAECIGEYFIQKWKLLLCFIIVSAGVYVVYIYTPDGFLVLLNTLREFLFVQVPSIFGSVQSVHLVISSCLTLSTIKLIPEYKMLCSIVCWITWIILLARIFNYLWPPLLYVLVFALVIDEPDRVSESRIRSVIVSLLQRLNLVPSTGDAIDEGVDESGVYGPAESTPIPTKVSGDMGDISKFDPKIGVIPHPGVSALKKEHGILQNRPNLSEIGKVSTPLGSNTPKSRLGRSFRYAKRKTSLASEIHHDSMRYIYWALWSCLAVQLWLHPGLLHLLPAPIFYSLMKRLFKYTGAYELCVRQYNRVCTCIWDWVDQNSDTLLPLPVRFLARQIYNLERGFLQATIFYMDGLVTSLLILGIFLVITVACILGIIQVYAESAYILQSLATIASSLEMKDSMLLSSLNISLPANSSMETVMDEAYTYGRGWISTTLRNTLENTDTEVLQELENKILELWDRSYQYWILKQDVVGPKMSTAAITTSFGEVMDKLYTQDLFNISAVQIFIRNNMGTLTSICEQVWSLFQGNLVFFMDATMGVLKVLFYSGSGFINFLFGIVIYITALFYLLSNSSSTYKPLEVLGQYAVYQGSGVGTILQTAVNSVLFITFKMALFYLLWTYLTHTIFQATIVVLPMIFSSFIAAVPFTGQYIVAVPACLELWLLQDRPVHSILLIIFQIAPSWLVDAAIYSEMKGGIHPWFTGLAVVGGVYVFGAVGAIYGPLALCVLYVLVNLYTSFMQEIDAATPVGYKSMRTPMNRSDTMM